MTHAHLDHSGRILLLIHKCVKGKIYSSQSTKELALALFKERNGFDRTRKWVLIEKPEKKARCANNGKVIAHEPAAVKNCCKEETEKIERQFVAAKCGMDIKIPDNLTVKLV